MFSILTYYESGINFFGFLEIGNLYDEVALDTELYLLSIIVYLYCICEGMIWIIWTVVSVFNPSLAYQLWLILRQIFLIGHCCHLYLKLCVRNTTRRVLHRHELYLHRGVAPVLIVKVLALLLLQSHLASLAQVSLLGLEQVLLLAASLDCEQGEEVVGRGLGVDGEGVHAHGGLGGLEQGGIEGQGQGGLAGQSQVPGGVVV